MSAYCECEQPVIDVEHDAGCRRCGRPVNFTPPASSTTYDRDRRRYRSSCSLCPYSTERSKRDAAEHAISQHLAYVHEVSS